MEGKESEKNGNHKIVFRVHDAKWNKITEETQRETKNNKQTNKQEHTNRPLYTRANRDIEAGCENKQ